MNAQRLTPHLMDETKGMLLGLLGVTAFGLTLPATRFIAPYLDPVFIGLGRAVVAAVVAAIVLCLAKQPFPTTSQLLKLTVVALGVVVGFPVLSAWAMQYVPASHGGVVLGILPLATAAVGVGVSKERPSRGFWVSGLMGSLTVISFALQEGSGALETADVALVGAVVSAAIGYAMGGQLSKELGGWQVICWALVLSLPFIVLPALIQAPKDIATMPPAVWGSFLYLALVSQLLGFFVWNKGLALGGIARVSQTQLLQPFITLAASAVLLSEPITRQTVIFAVLVAVSVGVGKRMPVHQRA